MPTIVFGDRQITTHLQTPAGTPVMPMWAAGQPTADQHRGAGFPVLTSAEHHLVWQPATREDGAYNHYATLIHHDGHLHLMWGNHPLGEDSPGQRILYARSDAWGQWTAPQELFPAPGPVRERKEHGIHLKPDRWMVIGQRLYAVVFVFDAGRYAIAREVPGDGPWGEPFIAFPDASAQAEEIEALPTYMPRAHASLVANQIRTHYDDLGQVSYWGRFSSTSQAVPERAIDGAQLIESFAYPAPDGSQVLMARNWGTPSNPVHNNRLYVSIRQPGEPWPAPYPTDIPDSPSRAEAVTLADGTVLLIGCQNAPAFDQALYLDRDPLTVAVSSDGRRFDRAFALRTAARNQYRFPGVPNRNHGYAYSSSVIHDNWLITAYSISKEDMAISRVRLSELGLE